MLLDSSSNEMSLMPVGNVTTLDQIEMSTINRNNLIDYGNLTIKEKDNKDDRVVNENRIVILSLEEEEQHKSIETTRLRIMTHMGKFLYFFIP